MSVPPSAPSTCRTAAFRAWLRALEANPNYATNGQPSAGQEAPAGQARPRDAARVSGR